MMMGMAVVATTTLHPFLSHNDIKRITNYQEIIQIFTWIIYKVYSSLWYCIGTVIMSIEVDTHGQFKVVLDTSWSKSLVLNNLIMCQRLVERITKIKPMIIRELLQISDWYQGCLQAIQQEAVEQPFDSEQIKQPDYLLPYLHHHGPRHSNRVVRSCQPAAYENVTFELYKSHFTSDSSVPVFEGRQFSQPVGTYFTEDVPGNIIKVNNPFKTFSILEPDHPGGCSNGTVATVAESADQRRCLVAMNGGFFNITTFACLGNLVVDGNVIQSNGGVQNAHFGIKKDSSIFVGYLPESADLSEFKQLIGGVIWLVRDGINYVDEAIKAECEDTQTTGSLRSFADVVSARTAIGHDREGRVVLVQIDGKTWHRGINLQNLADLLISMGVVNAINTDGGGSSTLVINGTLVSHPSDEIVENGTLHFNTARQVTTILCVHDLPCSPATCSHHGDCIHGKCHCHDRWAGPGCEHLQCGALNCSGHGKCTQVGCECGSGWQGADCNHPCPAGTYGVGCIHPCHCVHSEACNPVDGSCLCVAGYTGLLCDQECPYGFYGAGCRQICYCDNSCSCHHITGACNVSYHGTSLWIASRCLAESFIAERQLVPENREQYQMWLVTTIVLASIAALSIILNVPLICMHCTCTLFSRPALQLQSRRTISPAPQKRSSKKKHLESGSKHSNNNSLLQVYCDSADSEGSEEVNQENGNAETTGGNVGGSGDMGSTRVMLGESSDDLEGDRFEEHRNSKDSTRPILTGQLHF